MANGLPIEGEEAAIRRAGHYAILDVPTCGPSDRIGQVEDRVRAAGWDACVVVNAERVVLGLLRPAALAADPQMTAEQAMENGPRTYRLNAPLEKVAGYLQRYGLESVLITTSDGKLFGLLKRKDLENALSDNQEAVGE